MFRCISIEIIYALKLYVIIYVDDLGYQLISKLISELKAYPIIMLLLLLI